MNLKLYLAAVILTPLPGFVPPAVALQSDANQPIEIEADLMTLDEHSGLSIYRGNVRLEQGSLRITAQELTLRMENGRLQRMEILGTETSPALFRQLTDAGEEAQGTARRIEYSAPDSRMVLLGQAELLQGNNHIRSDRIDYNTESNSFAAGRSPESRPGNGRLQPDERVRIIITPQQNR